jgi:alanyl-tRNA synthetase
MTERLYYADSHTAEFSAVVLECGETESGFAAVLDRTAFFPVGGGQPADTGFIGDVPVTDVRESGGRILHFVSAPLEIGREYKCAIDWKQRFSRMQQHSGEHIVSGLVHKLYGYDNVGFHMGEQCVTIDFSGELSWDELAGIEELANAAVTDNLPVTACFPPPGELASMEYRSKKELSGDVRIVTIPDVDVCACCAPHVKRTGEIGIIKFTDCMRHRGGVRIGLLCGKAAYEDYRRKLDSVAQISAALSAKRENVSEAVSRILDENEKLRIRCGELGRELVKTRLNTLGESDGNICVFDTMLPEPARIDFVNGAAEKCAGVAALLSGSDREGYRYVIASRRVDLKAAAGTINRGIDGRGGGSRELIQGSAAKTLAEITDFFSNFRI